MGGSTSRCDDLVAFFAWSHLPAKLQVISKPFGELAEHLVSTLPHNAQLETGLQKLLEAKDCAVRAAL